MEIKGQLLGHQYIFRKCFHEFLGQINVFVNLALNIILEIRTHFQHNKYIIKYVTTLEKKSFSFSLILHGMSFVKTFSYIFLIMRLYCLCVQVVALN